MNSLLVALAVEAEPGIEATSVDVLSPYMWVFFVGFLVTFALTPIMRRLAVGNGIVDWPDLKRKNHTEPVPYLGGVAIFLGWLAGVFVCYFTTPHDQIGAASVLERFPAGIIVGALVIAITGLVDDVWGINPRAKLGGQLMAAGCLAYANVHTGLIVHLFNAVGVSAPPEIDYTLGAVLIAVLVLGGCNSVNLIDGLDGLAAGVVAIAAAGFLFISVQMASPGAAEDVSAATVFNDPV